MFCWVKFGYILPMCELLFCVVFSFNSSSLDMKSSHAGNDKDEITQADLMAVNKMYKTIFDEINSIGEDTERLPQIIIVDHVDGKSLKCKEEFEKYVCCNWRNNTALI